MEDTLRIILPVYFVLYFGLAFVVKSLLVAKRIGKSPLVLPKDDSAYGLVGRYFKLTLIAIFLYVVTYAVFPETHTHFAFIPLFDWLPLRYFGLCLLSASLVWTVIAQNHMRDSWRIGIDAATRTELVTTGLFGLSRNPIFLGMVVTLFGLFFATPNAPTLVFLVVGFTLIEVQVRLEEAHLETNYGERYVKYRSRVRRYL